MLSQNVTEQVGWAAPPQISRMLPTQPRTGVARTDRYLAGSRGARRESTWSQHARARPPARSPERVHEFEAGVTNSAIRTGAGSVHQPMSIIAATVPAPCRVASQPRALPRQSSTLIGVGISALHDQ